jgi:hypothetical protein
MGTTIDDVESWHWHNNVLNSGQISNVAVQGNT